MHVEDRLNIIETSHRFMYVTDSRTGHVHKRDAPEMASFFTEDGVFEFRDDVRGYPLVMRGREQLKTTSSHRKAVTSESRRQHFVTKVLTLDRDVW